MSALKTVLLTGAVAFFLNLEAHAGSVTLAGPDTADGTFSTSQLQSLATPGDTVTSGGLTGISLWGLLGGSDTNVTTSVSGGTQKTYGSIVTFNPTGASSNPNFDLRYYVVGTGGGQTTAVSLGQIDPAFVGSGQPVPFVAYQTSGGTLLSTPQLVIPGGPAGSTVQNLSNLQLQFVAAPQAGPGGVSTGVTVLGNVTSPGTTYTSFPGVFTPTAPVNVVNAMNQVTDTYTGIPLATFLNVPAGFDVNSQIVVAKGSDNYEVVFSLDELLNADGTANLNDLLAYFATGTDFTTSNDGIARTITAGDGPFKHGRWVSNLESLDVIDTTPLPAALPLFATGLGAAGVFGLRRKKKPAAIAIAS